MNIPKIQNKIQIALWTQNIDGNPIIWYFWSYSWAVNCKSLNVEVWNWSGFTVELLMNFIYVGKNSLPIWSLIWIINECQFAFLVHAFSNSKDQVQVGNFFLQGDIRRVLENTPQMMNASLWKNDCYYPMAEKKYWKISLGVVMVIPRQRVIYHCVTFYCFISNIN